MDVAKLNELSLMFAKALEAERNGGDKNFRLPDRGVVAEICRLYVAGLFPIFHLGKRAHIADIEKLLTEQVCRAIRLACHCQSAQAPAGFKKSARDRVDAVLEKLPELARLMASDAEAAFSNDPAAPGLEEVLLCYPAVEAITVQRLAHQLYLTEIPYIPRMLTEVAHSRTGIDIHPGATIGESFFIDHGTGVVIGETATIGNKVTLYHGVTLGAFNPLVRDERAQLRRGHLSKRHPDLEDHVTVYPNATILGGKTRVGHHSVIGGNVWLTHSVVPYSKVVTKEPALRIHNGHPEPAGAFKFAGEGI